MSIYGKENIKRHCKKVIEGKEYEVTLGALNEIYVPAYASYASDLRKVTPAEKQETSKEEATTKEKEEELSM